jgi:hypothetical protein
MKRLASALILSIALTGSYGAIINFDLSPAGTDHAVGLSPQNEAPPVTNSFGSGNEIGGGITFDTDTRVLSLSIGYGSAFGFTDLTGPATVMHIHGPAPTNVPAPAIISLLANHTPATNPALGGFIGGTVTLTPDQATNLLAGSNYINIHTALNPGGEIRGQLIPVAAGVAPTVTCPAPASFECDGTGGRLVALNAQVSDSSGSPLTVVWTVDGAAVQTNLVAASGPPTAAIVTLTAMLTLGQHPIVISVSNTNGAVATCTSSASVVDTTPPVITSASASPNVLWPPNHKMVPVTLSVTATDLCSSTVTCSIKTVTANETISKPGKGHNKSADWMITGPLSLQLRAERAGKGHGRIYSVVVDCVDGSGNHATTNVVVRVPHDQRDHSGQIDQGDNSNGQGNGHPGKGKGK